MLECVFRPDWGKRLFRCEGGGCGKTVPLIAGGDGSDGFFSRTEILEERIVELQKQNAELAEKLSAALREVDRLRNPRPFVPNGWAS